MKHATMNRRKALAAVAVAPAALATLPTLGLCKDATERGDVELHKLWAEYLATLAVHDEVNVPYREARVPYEAEYDKLKHLPEYQQRGGFGELHRMLWKKHGVETAYRPVQREGRKLRRIIRAIRKAKAETLFGIGVKLSVTEDPSAPWWEEAIEDARRSIAELTGVDFVAATGPIEV